MASRGDEMTSFCRRLEDAVSKREPVELWGVTYVPKARARMTERRMAILRYVHEYSDLNGWAPSVREICDEVGLVSPGSVKMHLDALVGMGYLRRGSGARALAVTDAGMEVLGGE